MCLPVRAEMMKVSEALKETWSAVVDEASSSDGYYHRRIPLEAPWPVHAGVHGPSKDRILILETEKKALSKTRLKDESKGYIVEVCEDDARRPDRLTIRIQETSQVYREIFTIFCVDILEHWVPFAESGDAIKGLSDRLARWKKFFQSGAAVGLSRETYIGL